MDPRDVQVGELGGVSKVGHPIASRRVFGAAIVST